MNLISTAFPTLHNFLKRCGSNIAICRLVEWMKVLHYYCGVFDDYRNIWKWGITIWIMLLIWCEWIIKTRWVGCWRWLWVDGEVWSASSCVQKEKSWGDDGWMSFQQPSGMARGKRRKRRKSSGCCRKAKVNLNKSELCKSAQGTRCCWVGRMCSVACVQLFLRSGSSTC